MSHEGGRTEQPKENRPQSVPQDQTHGEIVPDAAPQSSPPDNGPASAALGHADAATRERRMLLMQAGQGNRYAQRAVAQVAHARGRSVQRDGTPAPAPGVPVPAPAKPDLPKFPFVSALSEGSKFWSEYTPVGPVPKVGKLKIILKVSIDFKDFDLSMIRSPAFKAWFEKHRLTAEQRKDFKWSDKEKEEKRKEFGADFKTKVEAAWSGKHQFFLKDPAFSEYQAAVQVVVEVIADAAKAHNVIKLQKVPKGVEARFRSFVSGKTSVMDPRAAKEDKEPTSDPGYGRAFVTQIEPFDFDSAALTPALSGQVSSVAGRMRPLQDPKKTDTLLGDDWAVDIVGRASSKGEKVYNDGLGMRRAKAVEEQLKSELARPAARSRALSKGEEHASTDPQFQRVDLQVWNVPKAFEDPQPKITQNTAAHEAGHMFGLDDEYEEEEPEKGVKAKFRGDKPGDEEGESKHAEYDKVKELMGQEAADELRVQDSSSIMSKGMEVKRGHYVYFLDALNHLTSKHWSIG